MGKFRAVYILFILISSIGLVSCTTIPNERTQIEKKLPKDYKYLLLAFERQLDKIPFFDIASHMHNYYRTAKDKTIDAYLEYLKVELTGYQIVEDGKVSYKPGWRADIAEAYVDKLKRDYEFIKAYEK